MLFDEDFGFMSINLCSKDQDDKLYSTKEGFLRGNMFKNEYIPYQNYEVASLIPNTEQEAQLYDIMALSFAINDLNLYLDLNPYDTKKLSLINELIEKLNNQELAYLKNYGPLEVNQKTSITKYDWLNSPWPWENKRGEKYV